MLEQVAAPAVAAGVDEILWQLLDATPSPFDDTDDGAPPPSQLANFWPSSSSQCVVPRTSWHRQQRGIPHRQLQQHILHNCILHLRAWHLEICERMLEFYLTHFLNNCRHHCLQRNTKMTMTGLTPEIREGATVIQRNTHLGDNQQQQQQQQHWRQQQQLWRSPHPTVSNCHYHGKVEALRRRRRHPSPHEQAFCRQFNSFCCPLRASGSRRHPSPAGTTTSMPAASAATGQLAILRAITVATEAAPDANGRICCFAPVGHNTPDALGASQHLYNPLCRL
ncbi:hypothetical protein ACLKA7_005277 [Drosophila subpalustris]